MGSTWTNPTADAEAPRPIPDLAAFLRDLAGTADVARRAWPQFVAALRHTADGIHALRRCGLFLTAGERRAFNARRRRERRAKRRGILLALRQAERRRRDDRALVRASARTVAAR